MGGQYIDNSAREYDAGKSLGEGYAKGFQYREQFAYQAAKDALGEIYKGIQMSDTPEVAYNENLGRMGELVSQMQKIGGGKYFESDPAMQDPRQRSALAGMADYYQKFGYGAQTLGRLASGHIQNTGEPLPVPEGQATQPQQTPAVQGGGNPQEGSPAKPVSAVDPLKESYYHALRAAGTSGNQPNRRENNNFFYKQRAQAADRPTEYYANLDAAVKAAGTPEEGQKLYAEALDRISTIGGKESQDYDLFKKDRYTWEALQGVDLGGRKGTRPQADIKLSQERLAENKAARDESKLKYISDRTGVDVEALRKDLAKSGNLSAGIENWWKTATEINNNDYYKWLNDPLGWSANPDLPDKSRGKFDYRRDFATTQPISVAPEQSQNQPDLQKLGAFQVGENQTGQQFVGSMQNNQEQTPAAQSLWDRAKTGIQQRQTTAIGGNAEAFPAVVAAAQKSPTLRSTVGAETPGVRQMGFIQEQLNKLDPADPKYALADRAYQQIKMAATKQDQQTAKIVYTKLMSDPKYQAGVAARDKVLQEAATGDLRINSEEAQNYRYAATKEQDLATWQTRMIQNKETRDALMSELNNRLGNLSTEALAISYGSDVAQLRLQDWKLRAELMASQDDGKFGGELWLKAFSEFNKITDASSGYGKLVSDLDDTVRSVNAKYKNQKDRDKAISDYLDSSQFVSRYNEYINPINALGYVLGMPEVKKQLTLEELRSNQQGGVFGAVQAIAQGAKNFIFGKPKPTMKLSFDQETASVPSVGGTAPANKAKTQAEYDKLLQ